jgi:hypothetical protein
MTKREDLSFSEGGGGWGWEALNGIIYLDMLELWLMPHVREDKLNDIFQHDRASPRITHKAVTTLLNR